MTSDLTNSSFHSLNVWKTTASRVSTRVQDQFNLCLLLGIARKRPTRLQDHSSIHKQGNPGQVHDRLPLIHSQHVRLRNPPVDVGFLHVSGAAVFGRDHLAVDHVLLRQIDVVVVVGPGPAADRAGEDEAENRGDGGGEREGDPPGPARDRGGGLGEGQENESLNDEIGDGEVYGLLFAVSDPFLLVFVDDSHFIEAVA